jgi:hypothetical protein
MKWIKRLLGLLIGLLLGSALIVTAATLFLGESHYKRLLAWGAEQFLDSQLVIEGPLEIDFARNLSLATGDIRLKANDDSYRLSIGKLQTSFRLGSYLQTGTFWFNNLELTDVNLEVAETTDDDFDLEDIHIPPVVVARAKLNNLGFTYRELPPGTLHTFALDELAIDELGEHQPVSLRATGLFEGQPFELEGTATSIAKLVEHREPNSVQLALSSTHVNASVQGTIADPVNGRGLDLQIQADIPQIRELIEIVWDEIPVLGSLQGSLNVRGDYTAPQLEAIDLHLQRDREVDLVVTGSVADALSGTGLDLQLDGQSSNPEVISWLLFKKLDRMQAVQVNGRLQGDLARPSLHELEASAETADGLKLQLNGSAVIHPAGHRLAQTDAGLAVQFSAPTLAAANLPVLEDIPALEPVSGSIVLALAMDAVGIYAADIDIGRRDNNRIQLKGDVGYVRLDDALEMPGLKLQTDIQAAELARLGKQLDYALPALGPARLRGTLLSRGPELVLQGARLDIGTQGQTTLKATGMLATQLDDPARFKVAMDVDMQAVELARLGEQFDVTLPELGQTRITGRLESRESGLLFRDARLVVGAADQPTIRANGRVTTHKQKGSTIDARMDVAVAELIAAYTDQSPGYLGRLEGDAVISNLDGRWGVEKFNLASTRTSLYQLNLSGRYDDLVNHDEGRIDSNLVIKSTEKLGEVLDLNLDGMGSCRMQGLLSVDKGRLHYLGESTLGSTRGKANIRGHLQDGKPVLGGSVEVPVLHLADFGLGPPETPVPDKTAAASPHVFSREPLNIGFMNNVDLDLAVSIDEVEGGELVIDSVKGKLQLRNGHLSVTPLRLVFEGGNADINMDIRATAVPEYRLAMTADDLMLGPLMAQVQKQVPIRGYTNIHLDLQTQGRSPHEMASNLSGSVSLGLENARIPKHYVEMLSIDVFGWVVSKSGARQHPHMNLNCLVMTFAVRAGEVKSETFISDGPRLSLGGQIDMNLGAETLDIVIIPTQKKRFFSSISPVTVKGPMKDPKVEAVPVKAALQEIGTMALLPGVVIPARAVGKLWSLLDDDDRAGEGCANIEELREAAKRETTEKKAPAQDWDSDWE